MALKKIGGSDLKRSRSFKDFSVNFARNPFTDDLSIVNNDNSIKQAVKNIILTSPGEKPFQPLVGSSVNRLLFEPLDAFTADAVAEEIRTTINQYEPRVKLTKVNVTPIFEGNKLNVSLEYKIVGLPIVETIEFVLQRPE
ncbi:base plate wedge subunit [Prochlorococcus phage P-SSM7]|uniref:Base plate wedge subunit n=1 Tax=Prochlorococcus phage P-SSM7 TaxID=445688 RepID=E3SNK6_9CAUD|nr:baseplate wedge subunit [Prochlorococcus phage P-SSM7]ADO99015.1 base plate wedge subunit [Prochlorococcus phage P-SSM7]